MSEPARQLLVGASTALCVGVITWGLVRPLPRLGGRLRPYVPSTRAALGLPTGVVARPNGVIGPILGSVARSLSAVVDAASDDELARRLDGAGWLTTTPGPERVAAYRRRQLTSFVIGAATGCVVGVVVGLGWAGGVAGGALGAVVGATRQRGRLDRALEERRERMRLEVYAVDQVLALRIRAGSGVLQAVGDLTTRGRGPVVEELRGALSVVRAGTRPADAFGRLASATPEPHCARLYAALAGAEERGTDLSAALFALAADVRRARRDLLRRRAVRRRAAMLIPIIAVLAPVMLLFIIAPLPRIVLGGL